MPFKLTEEQISLQDSLRAFFAEKAPSEYLHRRFNGPTTADPVLWASFAELGLFEFIGSGDGGGTFLDLALIAQESGRAILPEPLVDALIAGPYLFSRLVSAKDTAAINAAFGAGFSAAVRSGAQRIALADHCSVQISKGRATGAVQFLSVMPESNYLLILGSGAVAIADTASEASLTPQGSLDRLLPRATVQLTGCPVVQLSDTSAEVVSNLISALRAAELAGIMAAATERTVDYVKTRKQFELPIGSFQAVQHQLADMHLDCEAIGSLASFAAWAAESSPEQFALAARSAIGQAAVAGPRVIEGAIQLHGGIGFTWEFDLHLYLRRAKSYAALYGLDDQGYESLMELL